MYLVKVKPTHPTGIRRRSGIEFTTTPVEVEEITKEIRQDPWLIVERVKRAAAGAGDRTPET